MRYAMYIFLAKIAQKSYFGDYDDIELMFYSCNYFLCNFVNFLSGSLGKCLYFQHMVGVKSYVIPGLTTGEARSK